VSSIPPPDFNPSQQLRAIDGVVDRREFVLAKSKGKRVLHLGCVDDRLLEQRMATGQLLHAQLAQVAAEVIGVDISEAGLQRLEEAVPGRYLHANVEHLDELDDLGEFDIIVGSELIEHLANPGLFLRGLRRLLIGSNSQATAIITTPNSYSWSHFLRLALMKKEWTHPDHQLMFSPYTLVQALRGAGLSVEELLMHRWRRGLRLRERGLALADNAVLRFNPFLASGLIAVVSDGLVRK
jgi:2-polyprenyl-3-methyl-5-hydroxy-6-metoxy-1,4-benzoquinol methylase